MDIFRFFVDLMPESYAWAILLLLVFSKLFASFRLRKVGILNNLNLIGISLATLAIIGFANDYVLVINHQYQSSWLMLLYFREYLVLSIVANSLPKYFLLNLNKYTFCMPEQMNFRNFAASNLPLQQMLPAA